MEEKNSRFSIIKEYLGIGLLLLSLITGVFGIYEYREQGKVQRVQYFLEMRHRFKDNQEFQMISDAILNDKNVLTSFTHRQRANYAGFFSEVALLVEAGYVSPEVAYYMFGFYAIECSDREDFWGDLTPKSKNWVPFFDFADKMRKMELTISYSEDFEI